MSTTTTEAPPRRMVSAHDRDWGTNAAKLAGATLDEQRNAAAVNSKRQQAILLQLLDAIQPNGEVVMTSRAELKASANTMQELYYVDLVNGAGSRDARGTGNTPETSWWWLTTWGEKVARATQKGTKA